ncbi:helix-turn-helix domain-containing protein [Rhodococcus jostii]|uniref:AraC-like ligand-binding domain-containing protein n=1 Tax=Rhodococcus jostii TaxID=132919 RepID=UPI003646C76D
MTTAPAASHIRVQGTDGIDPVDRVDCWRDLVSRAFVPLDADAAAPDFTGHLRITELGSTIVSRVDAGAHTVRRTRKQISGSERGYYKLGLQLRGDGLLVQDGREALLRPGDFALYDTDQPYTLAFTAPTDMAVFMFPRPRLPLPPIMAHDILARRISRSDELGCLLSPLLVRLVDQVDDNRPNAALTLADAVLDLMAALLTGNNGTPEPLPHETLLVQAKTFIDANLSNPDLNPDLVAAAVHVSTRYLHKLFSADGEPVARWIRHRRLEQCRRDLSGHTAVPSVSAVGNKWGLPDAAHFSRAFKARFAMSPAEFHKAATASIRSRGSAAPNSVVHASSNEVPPTP